jgi:uncharacterized repeat protein (TIGR01451 family)
MATARMVTVFDVRRHLTSVALALVLVLGGIASPAFAAGNQVTGDVASDAGALVDSNVVTLTAGNPLNLVKRAYLQDGTRVPDSSDLAEGTVFDFLIYISNDSDVSVNDVSLRDVLDPAFAYQTGTIRIDNTVVNCSTPVCSTPEEDNVYLATAGNTPLNDAVDADVASYTAGTTTIDVGDENETNAPLSLAPQKVWAVVFTVKVQ